jgi:Flp pilus assembly protein TadD
VLNYLGYTWVDQSQNLKTAMDYIRKAVKLKPDDGYYIDSLGWAYYRLGNIEAAVEHLERAVELRPDDPVINDHLGDAYWRIGRKLEAKYQWQQSLTLKPDKDLIATIDKKLKDGMPDALATKAANSSVQKIAE